MNNADDHDREQVWVHFNSFLVQLHKDYKESSHGYLILK